MSTRAEQFSAKIHILYDYENRILRGIVPLPTGLDIANTLKYFTHTLLGILKDASEPEEHSATSTTKRRVNHCLAHYPSLDYFAFYGALVNLIDIVPTVQLGQHDLGRAILQAFSCILTFLEPEISDTLPHTLASTLVTFPSSLHADVVELICTKFLPVILSEEVESPTFAKKSIPAIMMLVLHYVTNKAYHAQLFECIFTYKKNAWKDIMCIIAYGSYTARCTAVHLLFHYWGPTLLPTQTEIRDFKYTAWKPVKCQRSACSNKNNVAIRLCMSPSVAAQYGDCPPPLYLCVECSNFITKEVSKSMLTALHPHEKVSKVCENKNCCSPDRKAVCTCYTSACTSRHGNRPVRYCATCHQQTHGLRGSGHTVHHMLPSPWTCDSEGQTFMVEAIIRWCSAAAAVCGATELRLTLWFHSHN